jgi:hypothetical protein
MRTETEKTLTKKPLKRSSIFLSENDQRRWLAAAAIAGMSRSELLRVALREKSEEILSRQVANG